ncbi:hypothetical protein PL263_08090 [Methylomonas sp. EFPC3]|uniref:CopG family transcriptional regulator n=1 Tax=Methylomonas aurea TaxID=2952224 RepID=A0ABT1UJ55_9GAMM|nr:MULTISPECIES: hypothetical protein [Methylomonas]MCQ8181863.1 hypothetical protein [Methylomonas sp. SURF-1]WFP51982.1 hypothetical protein PL263_08090 [Methylomonas sp. EFPC3]
MIQLPQPTETLLINAATVAGQSPLTFLDNLLREYLDDQADIQAAAQSLTEPGEISLDEMRLKYDL